jgi:biotin carboxylase
MTRLLLLMGAETYRAPDFVAAARKLGVDLVVGTDAPSGAASLSPAHQVVLPLEDPDRATEAILALHKAHPLAGVVSADDAGVVLAAKASHALGLPGNPAESAIAAGNKAVFRDIVQAAGLPGPWHREADVAAGPEALARSVPYPCVLKPLFLAGSRGVIRADTAAEFVAAFARIARILADPDVARRGGALAGKILVEGFIPGAEVAVEGLLADGGLQPLAVFDKPDPLDGPFFEETLYVTPSRQPEPVQRALLAAVERAAQALGLRTGAVHAEVRLEPVPGGVRPVPVELAARSIGGHCSRSLVFGAGMSLEELILRQALGLAPGPTERAGRASGVMMLPIPRAGVLRGVTGREAALAVPGIAALEIGIRPGDTLVPLPEGHRYLGFLFAKGARPEAVEAALRRAHACLGFEIEGAGDGR